MSIHCPFCSHPSGGKYRCDPAEPYMCGPCQKLVDLDKRIEESRTVLIDLISERQRLTEDANHNHDRPPNSIHVLPSEIMADIFESVVDSSGVVSHLHSPNKPGFFTVIVPLVFMAVCQRWRTIAQSVPQLWTSIPLHSISLTSSMLKEWIDRTGDLPLSVHISSSHISKCTRIGTAFQFPDFFRDSSSRWVRLYCEGLPHLSRLFVNLTLPKLRTLILHLTRVYYTDQQSEFFINPMQLNTLEFKSGIQLGDIKQLDWQHLTQLDMHGMPSDCIEAFRRAPHLTHCTFASSSRNSDTFPFPQTPIVHSGIQFLNFSGSGSSYKKILQHSLCPSLKTIILHAARSGGLPQIVEFLMNSGCSLETLSLGEESLSKTDISSLCHGIPTLQHLHADFSDYYYSYALTSNSVSKELFAHLEIFLNANGKMEPHFLPALRTLTLELHFPSSDWTTLPKLFGGSTTDILQRCRRTLESIVILSSYNRDEVDEVDDETLKNIMGLREAGVELKVKSKYQESHAKDRIDIAIEKYNGVLMG
jgi:endogenous inhibitor of DNA gyrase (YacG/DUF329 family)